MAKARQQVHGSVAGKRPNEQTVSLTGGQAGTMGYLAQTLIALLDGLLAKEPYQTLTLEPRHQSEKFDIIWTNAGGSYAVQVKSTSGQFSMADVRKWADEMEHARKTERCTLCLVGLYAQELARTTQIGHVRLEKWNYNPGALQEQAAHRLESFLRREGLYPGTGEYRALLVNALVGRLSHYATRGEPIPRTAVVELLKQWVAATLSHVTDRPLEFYSCFVCCSSKDEDLAKRLYADLQAKGVRCWFAPEDMKIGDRIRVAIDESIRVYDKLLLVLSEPSLQSDWVEKEVETAMEKEREQKRPVLFPIRVDDAVMDIKVGWAADIRRNRHIGDFTRWKNHDAYQKAFDRLLRDLKADKASPATCEKPLAL